MRELTKDGTGKLGYIVSVRKLGDVVSDINDFSMDTHMTGIHLSLKSLTS